MQFYSYGQRKDSLTYCRCDYKRHPLHVFTHIHYKEQYMFKLKSFISLIFAALATVVLLNINVAQAEEPRAKQIVASATMININSEDAAALASAMKGVGLKKAQAIIDYRTTYGAFHDANELLEVKGIGKSILEKNIKLISRE